MAQCAGQVKKVSLELGGNAPFIVFDDADLAEAVAGAVMCKFRNSGQTCISANRFLVQDGIYDDFVARFTEAAAALKVADGFTPGVQVGPLIDEAGDRQGRAPRGERPRARRRAPARREPARGPVLRAVGADRRDDGDGDELRGDVRPGRGDPPLRDRGRGRRDRERHAVRALRLLLLPGPRPDLARLRRRSSTGSSGSTPASSRPRWRRSAGSRNRASGARGRATASTTGSS